jgi:hypothetical protein
MQMARMVARLSNSAVRRRVPTTASRRHRRGDSGDRVANCLWRCLTDERTRCPIAEGGDRSLTLTLQRDQRAAPARCRIRSMIPRSVGLASLRRSSSIWIPTRKMIEAV